MDLDTIGVTVCQFCKSSRLRKKFEAVPNKRSVSFGTFDIWVCRACSSLTTHPLPSKEALQNFYSSSECGIDRRLRELRGEDSQESWYQKIIKRIKSLTKFSSKSSFSWLELGPGNGELAQLMSAEFPLSRGVCVDFHSKPIALSTDTIDWVVQDLNSNFSLGCTFDLIVSISVIEHVLDIESFISNMKKHGSTGSFFYLVAPNQSSLAAFMMDQHWPYFLPGEHLHVPTVKGLEALMKNSGFPNDHYRVSRIAVPYSLRYMAGFFNIPGANKIPKGISFPFPVGAVEAQGCL